MNETDTIAAIATPIGEGGISVIRLSGPDAFKILEKIFRAKSGKPAASFSSHTIHAGEIRDLEDCVDQVLVSLFRAPHSYTGEDVIEINGHGGLLVTRNVVNLLIQNGARHAEPGEFTKRAFLNGKIDLPQAEAVLDLIKAKSERSLAVAARQLAGNLSLTFKSLRDRIMTLYAHLEAYLDFPDEDLECYSDLEILKKFGEVEKNLESLIASFKRGHLLREGVSVAIVGRANTGKSSLFNALLERDRALVSHLPGTTRDALEETLEIEGIALKLIDTAGFFSSSEQGLDRLAMEKSREALKEAGLVLYIVDSSSPLGEEDRQVLKEIRAAGKFFVTVLSKSDLSPAWKDENLKEWNLCADVKVSSRTREGLAELEKIIGAKIFQGPSDSEGEQVTRLRHKNALEKSLEHWKKALQAFGRRDSLELVTVDLKASLDALRELIGEIYSEDLLDVIFSEFCIGK